MLGQNGEPDFEKIGFCFPLDRRQEEICGLKRLHRFERQVVRIAATDPDEKKFDHCPSCDSSDARINGLITPRFFLARPVA
jgi:hypothetical protein